MRKSVNEIPFMQYGEWLLDPMCVPQPSVQPRRDDSLVLSRFQRMFGEKDVKGKELVGYTKFNPSLTQLI